MFSLKARRSGLSGEVLRDPERKWPLRLVNDLFLTGGSDAGAESALKARDSAEGDLGAVGEVLVGDLFKLWGYRAGLEGERESERRICWIEAYPSIVRPCA